MVGNGVTDVSFFLIKHENNEKNVFDYEYKANIMFEIMKYFLKFKSYYL